MRKIPLFKVAMSSTISEPVTQTLLSGFVGQGPKVEEFEAKLRANFGIDHLLTVNSGTSALHLAMHLLKLPFIEKTNTGWVKMNDGDEVLTTPLTCLATNMPIAANNLQPKWVDVDRETMNMDLDDLEKKISEKTKAILVVHWAGYPVDLDRLKNIQSKAESKYGFRIAIIEDCAHAFGSKFNGQLIGTHGNICAFSFQAIKHLTTVDGGMLVMPDEAAYQKAKLLRWYGLDRNNPKTMQRCEEDVEDWGFKFHMNDVNATVGIENLKFIEGNLSTHKKNSAFYDKELKNIQGIELLKRDNRMESSAWVYTMLVERKKDFMQYMEEHGISVSQVHERNDKHTCFKEFQAPLSTLDEIIPKLISIPVGAWVTEEDRGYIVEAIKKGW